MDLRETNAACIGGNPITDGRSFLAGVSSGSLYGGTLLRKFHPSVFSQRSLADGTRPSVLPGTFSDSLRDKRPGLSKRPTRWVPFFTRNCGFYFAVLPTGRGGTPFTAATRLLLRDCETDRHFCKSLVLYELHRRRKLRAVER